MVSKERLEQIARLEVEILTFPPNHAQVAEMAMELLAWRKAAEEPVAYTDAEELEIMRKGTFADMFTPDDSYKSDPQWIPLFTRAAPPAPFVVKLPKRYSIDAFDRLEPRDDGFLVYSDDVIEAIKAAGGSIEDE